jgi:hypothetical protein
MSRLLDQQQAIDTNIEHSNLPIGLKADFSALIRERINRLRA